MANPGMATAKKQTATRSNLLGHSIIAICVTVTRDIPHDEPAIVENLFLGVSAMFNGSVLFADDRDRARAGALNG